MTAAWTTPRNWNTGDLVTASDLNTHLRDNLEFLKTPPMGTADLTSSSTTTSTSFVSVSGLSLTISTAGGRVQLAFSGTMQENTAGAAITFTFSIDGVDQGHATNGIASQIAATAGVNYAINMTFLTAALSAGSHTFTVRWKVTSGTGTLLAGTHFNAREV